MFEAAELGRKIERAAYAREVPRLRAALLKTQQELRERKIPLILVVAGGDGAGKSEMVNRLHEWFDPRGVETHAFGPPSDEERERPRFWRFWRTLPERGRIGIFFGSWYTDPIIRRAYGKGDGAQFQQELARIEFFERQLAEDGALVVKVWLHLSKKAQRKKLKQLEERKETRWRIQPIDWKHLRLYDRFVRFSEEAIRHTDTGLAPWTVVEAEDDRYREITVGRALVAAAKKRLRQKALKTTAPRAQNGKREVASVLDSVDLSHELSDAQYEKKLVKLQARLHRLSRAAWQKKVSSVLVMEGWDAAGKGGATRRLTEAMDARLYRVVPIAAPTDEERAHHYLWRFWRHIPRTGRVTIFDRSWYGRVLVERVEGFAREDEWRRAYLEINEFEDELIESDAIVMKFWVHISREEQLRRFKERQKTAFKQYKITEEDWRNRQKWPAYEEAINEMIVRTSREVAPWTLIAGQDKRYARIQILETVCDRLDRAV